MSRLCTLSETSRWNSMARLNAKNNAETVLVQAVSESDTEFIVEDAGALPAPPYRLSIEDEIVEVSAVDGNALTVERAVEDTQSASYGAGTAVESRFTAGMHGELISEEEFASHKADYETHEKEIATTDKLGHVKVDGETIVINDGVISGQGTDIIENSFTVTVGSSGDFQTINEALKDLTKYRPVI